MSRVIYKKMLKDAIKSNNSDILELVVDNLPTGVRYCDNLLMRFACKHGYTDVVRRYLFYLAVDPGARNHYALRKACKNNHSDIVDLLLRDVRVDPSAKNNAALINAAKTGNAAILNKLLCHDRVDPSARSNAALRFAVYGNHIGVIHILLSDKRVDPSDLDNDAIKWALYKGFNYVAKLLLLDSRVILPHESFPNVAEQGNTTMVEMYLYNLDFDVSMNNNTALRFSALNGHIHVVKLLLQHPNLKISRCEYQELLDNVDYDKKITKLLKRHQDVVNYAEPAASLADNVLDLIYDKQNDITQFSLTRDVSGKSRLVIDF